MPLIHANCAEPPGSGLQVLVFFRLFSVMTASGPVGAMVITIVKMVRLQRGGGGSGSGSGAVAMLYSLSYWRAESALLCAVAALSWSTLLLLPESMELQVNARFQSFAILSFFITVSFAAAFAGNVFVDCHCSAVLP